MKIPNINTIERYARITALPDWVCPKCGASDAEDIIDRWPPVYGPIATECRQCDYGELEPGVTYAHAA